MSKANKHRGRCRTHGRGHKAGRGAGKRGGRGLAGINKHRVMTRIKYMPNHWGMHGFNRDPSLRTVHVTCNVSDLEGMANGKDSVDLTEMGIDKLLGSGRINTALTVIVGADKYPEPPLVTVTVSIDASMIVAIVAGSSCDND